MSEPKRPPITATLVAALSSPIQITLAQLIEEYEWDESNVLEALRDMKSIFDAWDFECIPPIGDLGLDDSRVIRCVKNSDPLILVNGEIARGENASVEFKETLVLDVKMHLVGGKPLSECYSERVLHSALKTIAAFLNGSGGILLIGVTDAGRIVDVAREFSIIPGHFKSDFDGWELFLRSMLEKQFHGGRSISASVQVTRVDHPDGIIARIVVGPRRELCFMKSDTGDLLYVRAGNRTLSVKLSELEQYFTLAKLYT